MCFSAKASFIAAGALSVIGLLSIRKATNTKKLIPLASTPLLFALQQASEGLVWIALTTEPPHYLYNIGIYTFVFFAGAWWPLYTATILYTLEEKPTRKKLLFLFSIFGITTGILYFISLITQPVQAFVVNHHIYYPVLSYPFGTTTSTAANYAQTILSVMYLISTAVPCFLSSIQFTSLLGVVLCLAFTTSQLFFVPTTASTWCFFAAIASILIYFIVRKYEAEKNS